MHGVGTNKSEAKKDAAKNSLKIVAPNIYAEIYGVDAVITDQKQNRLPNE